MTRSPTPHGPPRPRDGRVLLFAVAALLAGAACGDATPPPPPAAPPPAPTSSTLALAADDRSLWVVTPDADSVSLLDVATRRLVAEVPLGDAPPAVDPVTHRYDPRVAPRALALAPDGRTLYVAGQRAGRVFVVDTASRTVRGAIAVPPDPVGVVVAPDGRALFAVSHEAAVVSEIDPATGGVVASIVVGEHPWGATVSADGKRLYVTHLLRHTGVTVVDTATRAVVRSLDLADEPPDPVGGKRVPNGVPRGAYVAVPRPGSGELWVPHLLLAVQTPQPELDFESTVFPTVTTLAPDASAARRRLRFQPLSVPHAAGAFTDSVSGPRALAFTPDGALALLALAQSEDVMVFDAERGAEVGLVRPLPGALLEGIVVDRAGRHAYVDGRATHDVTVLALRPGDAVAPVAVDGPPIDRLARDPMPAELRLGQRLFYTANSAAYPVTKNFWVACASCHIEGGSDAVTWRFAQGPRDTPSNAGGPLNAGFLFRQATRSALAQYDRTFRVEQGASIDRDVAAQRPLLDAVAAFVQLAIPFPTNPYRAPGAPLGDAAARGQKLFAARCASCHRGDFFTDSGAGNPTLDLAGPIVLHDVGTCVKGGDFPDKPAADELLGHVHAACDFDTPTLRGVFATPPYFHDGSAATLDEVMDRLPSSADLTAAEKADLVAYVKTL